ncbi:MAG TPA: helix-turn-helix domain-containing protein [candidate division Zixibacteria bacterium]|nr:helix-turn-helix domain-containing protein [candidate division Zixibacteria bacterium]
MSLESYEKWQTEREEKKRKERENLAAARQFYQPEVQRLIGKLKRIVPECGLNQTQLSRLSGIAKSTLTRIMRKRHDSARFDTIVRLLAVAGYRIEIVPIDPRDDIFRELRRLKPPPLEDAR